MQENARCFIETGRKKTMKKGTFPERVFRTIMNGSAVSIVEYLNSMISNQ